MATLDLIVFLPVEERDRIALPSSEDGDFRLVVDEKLREILLEDSCGFDAGVLEVTGSPRERAQRVLMALGRPGFRV